METLSVKESAFHTRTNRFYQLEALERSGWVFPFEELHHRKVVIVQVATGPGAQAEVQKIRQISDIPGTQVIAFPTENDDKFFFETCGLHPNDASFKIMAADTSVFELLKSLAKMDTVKPFQYFYLNRNSHLQCVADSADAMLAILHAEQG